MSAPPSRAARTPDVRFGRYHALLIGNGDYASLPDLETSHDDVRALGQVLEQRYGFQVTTLLDATRYQVLGTLEQMRSSLGEDDNVLIYFSGRGALEGASGYWLPADAKPEQRETWISNQQLTEVLDARAVVFGSPTLNNGMYPTVADFLCYMKGLKPQGKMGAVFGSYGWGGGATKAITEELQATGVELIEPPLQFPFLTGREELEQCKAMGKKIAARVKGA